MTPSLIAIDGPLKGTTFSLDDGHLSAGRDEANQLVVNDLAVSRCHCQVEQHKDRWKITDLESRNGTFVNGVPIRNRWLESGDEIRIGRSVFLFVVPSPDSQPVQGDQPSSVMRSTTQLRREDAVYLGEKPPDTSVPAERAARDLKALLQFSSDVQQAQTRAALWQLVLKAVLETTKADFVAVFASGSAGFEFTEGVRRDGSPLGPFTISPDIAAQVGTASVAVLANPESGADTSGAAAPITTSPSNHGVLYAESGHARFDEPDLQLITAFASIAGLVLQNISRLENLGEENARLKEQLRIRHAMVGESSAMRAIYDVIAKVSRGDSTALILGENGTGKELAAHAIHLNSPRSDRPFIAVNCATLTESLLESELFGHEKGAFTGAIAQRKGRFELADTGTIFLDEIGDLAPSIQARLLRVLQQREFERVGGTKTIKVDVRVVAATNRDLKSAVKDGSFRQDLYFRLNVISLTMPPLRDRRDDIPLLANYFVSQAAARIGRRVNAISSEARELLIRYDWPGNVRELENAIERAVVMGMTDVIQPVDLPEPVLETDQRSEVLVGKYHEMVNATKREVIRRALEQAHGVQTEAAKLLGIHPVYLNRMIRAMKPK